jgi:predicted metal-dependent hydrolase
VSGIEVVRHAKARRVKLGFDPATGRVRLTLPRRASLKAALAWAEGQGDWIAAQRARLGEAKPFLPGLDLCVGDEAIRLDWREGRARSPLLEGSRLVFEGPLDTMPRRAESWLRRRALDILSAETAEFASHAGVTVSGVRVADPRGRWGSCAASGMIRYSWRLILAPGWVRRATVAHEVAHRVHMNHSPAFHAVVAALLGEDPMPARAWLREHGAALHRFGRSSGA